MSTNNRHTFKHAWLSIGGLLLISLLACKKNFRDYNVNPNNATEEMMEYDNLSTGVFFSQMEQNIFPTAQPPAFGDEMYQTVQNLAGDVYSGYMGASNNWFSGSNNTTYSLTPSWYGNGFARTFLGVMPAWLSIKKKTEHDISFNHIFALAQILKVEAVHRTTDMYGPLPYTRFGSGSLTTEYDSQQDIYKSFFTDLDAAVTVLADFVQKNPSSKPLANYDLVYGGDYVKWIKFANSLRLRLAMRVAYADAATAKLNAEAAVNNAYGVMQANDDNAALKSANGVQIHNPLQIICFNFDDIRMGANMQSFLTGYKDPRLPALFNKAPDGNYHGIRNGINITNKSLYTTPFSTLNVTSETPIRWMCAAEMYFLKAEGVMRGWNMGSGTAQDFYNAGIQTSFDQWGAGSSATYVADSLSRPLAYVDPSSSGNNVSAGTNLSTVMIKWREADGLEVKLEKILTQKWIAMYPDGQEAWTEFRRMRYPKVFPVVVNNSGGLINSATQIRRLPFSTAEYQSNPGGVAIGVGLLGGPDNGGTKLWWDKKP